MSQIPEYRELCTELQRKPFICLRCGACCREIEPGSNIVMVGPEEVRAIMARTGLPFDEVAEPYPDTIREDDREYTLAWAIIREEGRCRFFINGSCSVYEVRPWICRTYPYMLENGHISISPCSGVGSDEIQPEEVTSVDHLAADLLARQRAESEEEERIATVLCRVKIPAGQFVVIDSEGMRIIDG